jgi:hypothetical protein
MSKIDNYVLELNQRTNKNELRDYLLANSNLPGPRGNLELAAAAAQTISAPILIEWALLTAEVAPVNTAEEFLAFCGVYGQGRLYLEGDARALDRIFRAASDSRWRTREAAAMALQTIGKKDLNMLLKILPRFYNGKPFEQRCAVAAMCEPCLLTDKLVEHYPIQMLEIVTRAFVDYTDRKDEGFIALKKGLAYGWSVAAAANLEYARPFMERWLQSDDKDVRWVMQENLKKNRLIRLDPEWVARWKK